MTTSITGGCQCGQLRYELHGAPLYLFVCHCRDCQKQSGSAFAISVLVMTADVTQLSGTPKIWRRSSGSGRPMDRCFCAECGTTVWDRDPDYTDDMCLKGGTLDQPLDLSGAIHIWTASRTPGDIIPDGAIQFPGEPEQPQQ